MSEAHLASQLRLLHSSHHVRTTDAAMTSQPTVPGHIANSLELFSSQVQFDDIEGALKFSEVDSFNLSYQPPVSLHPFQIFNETYENTCFTQGYNYEAYTPTAAASPLVSSRDLALATSTHSDEYVNYGYGAQEYQQHSSQSSFSDDSQHSSSYSSDTSQLSSFTDTSRHTTYSDVSHEHELPFSSQQKQGLDDDLDASFRYKYFVHSTVVASPPSLHADHLLVANETTGTSVSTEEELTMLSPPLEESYLNIPQERAPALVRSLFPNPPKRSRDGGFSKMSKGKRSPKKPKVLKEFPTLAEFVYDPSHEYDAFVTPTSAAMALLMSCLKPTKKDQKMVLKENKRQFWQQTSAHYHVQSYVDRILASETLVAMLFKSKKGPIACNHCSLQFENYLALAGHFDEYNVARPGRCKNEGCLSSVLGFASPSEQSRHLKTQHGSTSYKCSVEGCNYHSPRLDCLKRHYGSVHNFEADSRHISKGVQALKDLPSKFQDVKKSKTLTDEEIRQQVAPVLAKFRELI